MVERGGERETRCSICFRSEFCRFYDLFCLPASLLDCHLTIAGRFCFLLVVENEKTAASTSELALPSIEGGESFETRFRRGQRRRKKKGRTSPTRWSKYDFFPPLGPTSRRPGLFSHREREEGEKEPARRAEDGPLSLRFLTSASNFSHGISKCERSI